MELNKIYQMDCIEGMKQLEDDSINLICIDPPYNIGKDKRWDKYKQDDYIAFMGEVFKECERLLKPNGSFYWFHNDMKQVWKLMKKISDDTNFSYKSFITIDKQDNNYVKDLYGSQEHFRNYLNLAEYCLFYTLQKGTGLDDANLIATRHLQEILKKHMRTSRLTFKQLSEGIGVSSTAVKHWVDYPTQPRFPKEENYNKLKDILSIPIEFDEIQEIYKGKKIEAEKERYTFNETHGSKNVWSYHFREGAKTKHPTQKPIKLIQYIIECSSNEGDVVLDCFIGSGTTAVAAERTKRNYIGFEREPEYIQIAQKRIEDTRELMEDGDLFTLDNITKEETE